MRITVLFLILIAAVIIIAGYNERTQNPSGSEGDNNDTVVAVTQLAQINASLQKGPVLLKIGAEWCGPCRAMKPILNELSKEYEGKATIMSIDVDRSPDLANYFVVNVVPDSSVIVGIENNEYVYKREDGKANKNRFEARIVGFREKQEFERILNLTLQKENGNSK